MEIRVPRGGGAAKAGKPNAPPGRIQKHAPASLNLDVTNASKAPASDLDDDAGSGHDPIPLLSPLVTSTMALWDAQIDDEAAPSDQQGEETSLVYSPAEGWSHPALPMAVMEPASLAPLFHVQCALAHNMQ